jgi:predicted RNA-binding Zn ribbon-like protein
VSQGNRNSAGTGETFKVHSRAATAVRDRRPQRNGPVTVSRLDPLAEEAALFLADGDRSRLRILSASAVIVQNRPRGWVVS